MHFVTKPVASSYWYYVISCSKFYVALHFIMVLHILCYVVMHNASVIYVDMPVRYRTIRYVNLCYITLCLMHQST